MGVRPFINQRCGCIVLHRNHTIRPRLCGLKTSFGVMINCAIYDLLGLHNNGCSMDMHGLAWMDRSITFMNRRYPWICIDTKDVKGSLWICRSTGYPWISVKASGYPCILILTKSIGFKDNTRTPTEIHGYPRRDIQSHRWISDVSKGRRVRSRHPL